MASSQFEEAISCLETGNATRLNQLLSENPGLAHESDDGNATLLIRLIDYPGHRPNNVKIARTLVQAGADVDARRNEQNGTALAGALCTNDFDLITALVELGADVNAPLGWMPGTTRDFADRMCQDLGKQHDDNIIALSNLFTQASGKKIPSQAPFGSSVPIVYVADVDAAKKFYTEQLGFHVDWIHQEPECTPYIGLSRGCTDMHLTDCGCDDNRHTGNLWLRIECDSIDDLYTEFDTEVVKVIQTPKNQPWGFRELDIEDPDGNRFTFFGPTKEEV